MTTAENDAGTLECGHPWAPRWSVPGQAYGWCETCECHKRVIPPAKSEDA